jgi:hypothetical protein
MTPTERRLAKLEQTRPGHFEPWGRVIQHEWETQEQAIQRTFGEGPVPENLVINVIYTPDRERVEQAP